MVKFILFVLLGFFAFIPTSHAYLDPGTGSMVVQMVIGAIAAAGIAIKIYWSKIKSLFGTGSNDSTPENHSDS